MKRFLIALLAVMISMTLGFSAYAKEGKHKGMSTAAEDGKFFTKASGSTFKANDFLGARVENREEKKLGTIKELAIDPKTEKVAFAVIDRGMGKNDVAIPLKALSLKTDDKGKIDRFVLNMTEDQFANAPGFERDSWEHMRSGK